METLNAFEYLQRRFLVPMRHDYITEQTLEVAESIDRSSECMKKRSWNVFNKVDLMETLISWVVCRTLFLLLRVFNRWHNDKIVKLGIVLDIMSTRPDLITLCTVEYSVLILLCKSAVRLLFSSVV